jgi:single stranded DNA-binding protein
MSARRCYLEIIGNVGVVPEFKHKDGQTPFAVCTVAVNRLPKKGQKREPLWYRVILFGQQATAAVEKGYKGQQVFVAGEFDIDEYTPEGGDKRTTLELKAGDFQMLGEAPAQAGAEEDAAGRGSKRDADKGAASKVAAKGGGDDVAAEY